MGAALFMVGAASCATPGSAPDEGVNNAQLRPLESQILAIAGEPLAIPIAPVSGPDPQGRNILVKLDNGLRLKAELHRLNASTSHGRNLWFSHTRRWWEGHTGADGPPGGPGLSIDVVIVDLPDGIDGRAVQMESLPLNVIWRDEPGSAAGLFDDAPTPQELSDPAAQVNLYKALMPALNDPLARWRCRLLADRLRSAGLSAIARRIDGPRFGSVALETLAHQIELRWRLALERLTSADPMTAKRLAQALTRLSALDAQHVAPVWPPAVSNRGVSAGLDQLLADLLDMDLSDRSATTAAQAWLGSLPRAVAWVTDDAGGADPAAGFTLARFGVTDLIGDGGVASATLSGSRAGPRVTVEPAGTAILAALAPLSQPVRAATIQLGSWNAQLPVVTEPIPARPPGVRMSPLFAPWSLTSWLSGAPVAPAANHATAALLQRRTDGSWELYLECRTPDRFSPAGDAVRIWFGPTARPIALVRVDPRGFFIDELTKYKTEEDEQNARRPIAVTKLKDRWVCALPIPDAVIEPGGYLRLALERRDDAGDRSTWPRPVLPWTDEPGRALLDLNVWMGK